MRCGVGPGGAPAVVRKRKRTEEAGAIPYSGQGYVQGGRPIKPKGSWLGPRKPAKPDARFAAKLEAAITEPCSCEHLRGLLAEAEVRCSARVSKVEACRRGRAA
jgi:hypothetical protein